MSAAVRAELPPMPDRIAALPVVRGYPVPWFVAWLDADGNQCRRGQGEPDFRVLEGDALEHGYWEALCWICGQPRGRYAAFVAGPMCAINRTSAEPPSHPECAGWAACACPFMARPHAVRREAGLPTGLEKPAGTMLRRNPGVALVWASRDWRRWHPPGGGVLYNMGTPEEVQWFVEGRLASRDEVLTSIRTGLPLLQEMAELQGPAALAELEARTGRVITDLAPR